MLTFTSTRDTAARANAREAVLRGLAPDGGLYMPSEFPRVEARACVSLNYEQTAAKILSALLQDYPAADIETVCHEAYAHRFDDARVTPLVRAGDAWVLELFHGETAAFKDLALSALPRLVTCAKRGLGAREKTFILTATSGDTGSAAMNGFRDVTGTGILTFYPLGGVSDVQKMQMTTMRGENVACCALRGNFDDCQTLVKRAFQTLTPPASVRFSSANSINIGRLIPQVAYYYAAYAQLLREGAVKDGEEVDFVVPTGNFGDILAGEFARRMGLPVGMLVCASNKNRVLTDFFVSGVYDRRRAFVKTLSPSMDILISSNLERLVYLAEGADTERVRTYMKTLSEEGAYTVSKAALASMRARIRAYSFSDEETLFSIARTLSGRGYLADPHTAVGFAALDALAQEAPGRKRVVLATASPFKFPVSVLRALGKDAPGDITAQMDALSACARAPIPRALKGLAKRPERFTDAISSEQLDAYILRKADELCR